MIKTFSLGSSSSVHWTILSFIRILLLCIYWFFSWKSKVSLSHSVAKCLFIKTIIADYLGKFVLHLHLLYSQHHHLFLHSLYICPRVFNFMKSPLYDLINIQFYYSFSFQSNFLTAWFIHCLPSDTTQSLLNPLKFTFPQPINWYVLEKCINGSYSSCITGMYTSSCSTQHLWCGTEMCT